MAVDRRALRDVPVSVTFPPLNVGQPLKGQLGFRAFSCRVDNYSNQYLKEINGGGNAFVTPNSLGVVIPLAGMDHTRLVWQPPDGIPNAGVIPSQYAIVTYTSDALVPSGGLPGTLPGGAVDRVALLALVQAFPGPLPSAVFSFNVVRASSTVEILVWGSAWGVATNFCNVTIDGANDPIRPTLVQTDGSHDALTPALIQRTSFAVGVHTIQLTPGVAGASDANDFFRILVQEIA